MPTEHPTGRRLLVVEDSRVISGLVTDALVRHGYECAPAFDGLEAVRVFGSESVDGIILDLNIPEVHGLEVLRHVKRARPETVVIVLTGHGSEQTAIEAVRLGADDYLTKPFREARLIESLEIHLRRADQQRRVDDNGGPPPREGVQNLGRLFRTAPVAMIHADSGGTIRAVNQATVRMLGRSEADVVGTSLEDLSVPEVRPHWLAAVRSDASGAMGYEGEIQLQGRNGPMLTNVVAVEQPLKGHLILALRDLTKQKAFEKRYFESKRLASLGRVVEGVAHEVRNPMISIGGFARKLREEFGEGSRQGRYLDVIVAEVERLEQMVRDIEEFALFSKQSRARCRRVDLREVLDGAVARVRARAEGDTVGVHVEGASDEFFVYGDPELLGEAFEAIVENAFEAMPQGGQVRIDLRSAERWARVVIGDTGVGIAEEDLDEIFDPFFTSKTRGAGLGLAKAYLVVEEHAGSIEFESQLGKGTVCTVSLPADRRSIPRAPP